MKSRFEWVLAGAPRGSDGLADIDLKRDPGAAIIPTLGSLIPGWVLIIPRTPALSYSMLDMDERKRLLRVAHDLTLELLYFGGHGYILEHGPAAPGRVVGCGVDQAHLHAVNLTFNLLSDVLADNSVKWSEAPSNDPWRDFQPDQEYYLIADGGSAFVGIPTTPQSQYFRRHIARAVGRPEQWDYREWPHYENVRRTAACLSSSLGLSRPAA